MIVNRAARTFFSDIDSTLVEYDLSNFDPAQYVTIPYVNGDVVVVPNKKNVNLLLKFYKLGYSVVAWSHSGADWAEAVVKALGIEHAVDYVVAKPHYYLDDLDSSKWMGHRVWRDPKTGHESS